MDSALAMGRPGGSSSVFHDGLGDRRRVADSTGTELVERLCLRAELTNVPSFEFALRERASRLASFRHPCFAAVRSIDRLNDATSTLAVVSEAVRGVRLSALLAKAGRPAIDINASIHLIRQLVSASAILHESAPDVAHGAIAPERLVITPNARVIVVEHVLGAALEQLRYSRDQYWSDLRVAVPASTTAVSHLDQRADVVQIGIVFLALILGRPLDDNEYPTLIADVLASAQALSANNEREPLPAGLRAWLTRMLQFDPLRSFDTAVEARDELERVLSDEEDEVSEELVTEPGRPVAPHAPEPATHASAPPRPPVQASTPTPPSHTPTPPRPQPPRPQPAPSAVRSEAAAAAVSVSPPKAPAPAAPPPATASTPVPSPAGASRGTSTMTAPASTPLLDPTKLPEPIEPAFLMEEPDAPSRWAAFAGAVRRRGRTAAVAVVAAIVLATGGFAAKRYVFGRPAAPVNGSLSVTSVPAGAQVLVDGEVRGLAPVTLSVAPGPHALELRGAGEPLKIPITVAAGQQLSQYVELAKSVAAFGQLQVRTEPTGALVMVDGIARGRSPVMVDTLAAGEHAVVLQSDLATVKQSVTIGAGQTASLVVPLVAAEGAPVSGWIAVAAPVELQVFENKRLLGTSQADRLMVSAGRHDIELVNDTLGYRVVRTVQVAPGKLTSMTLNWPTGSVALNALPWAEVFVDDKRIGETPIGNLSLPIGPHEVLFRHPDLGEQRQAFTVSLKSPVRVSADMRKKP